MNSRSSLRYSLLNKVRQLVDEYSAGYVILALKQISDQQLLHLDIPSTMTIKDPILKVYELTVSEIESVLFYSENHPRSDDELSKLLLLALKEVEGAKGE